MGVHQNAGYDDEYVKRRKVGQGAQSPTSNALPFEPDEESEWMVFVIYYQQAWELAQSHWNIGERLRWAARAEALADVIGHHVLCANNPKVFEHWNARQSEASHLIQALLASLQPGVD